MLCFLETIGSEADRAAFEEIYLAYGRLMFSVARRILRSDADAEDAVAQAFVSLIENLQNPGQTDCLKIKALCVLITENKAIDILRGRKRLSPEAFEDAVSGAAVPLPGDGDLADALAKLPARYREALLLRFYIGYSTGEMAKLLGMTQGAVQRLLWRAKDSLRRQMEKEGTTL